MHCVLQNVTPTLFTIWNRTKLDIDHGAVDRIEEHYLSPEKLDIISSALVQSRKDVPSFLGHAPRSIKQHYKGYKAAEWKAWLLFYGSPLLDQNMGDEYVDNFRLLGQFYRLATRHSLGHADICRIQQIAIKFVQGYERLYYHGDPKRLPVCTINTHYLLHFADYIRDCGPACYWWQFPMERYCGIIKPQARSKSQLNTSLNNAVVMCEHFNHIRFTSFRHTSHNAMVESFPALKDCIHSSLSTTQQRSLFYFIGQEVETHCYKRCQLRQDCQVGSIKSQRRADINRNDHRICYRRPGSTINFGEVQFFVDTGEYGQLAWVSTCEDLDLDREKNIASFIRLGRHEWIRVEWILSLFGILREPGSRVQLIITDVDIFNCKWHTQPPPRSQTAFIT